MFMEPSIFMQVKLLIQWLLAAECKAMIFWFMSVATIFSKKIYKRKLFYDITN